MTTNTTADYDAVLKQVAAWPAADRFALVQDVLKTLAPEPDRERLRSESSQHALGLLATDQPAPSDQRVSDEARRAAFDRLRGILVTNKPPPTDEEVKQWLEERRMEKYG
jgi:hypothetical protein